MMLENVLELCNDRLSVWEKKISAAVSVNDTREQHDLMRELPGILDTNLSQIHSNLLNVSILDLLVEKNITDVIELVDEMIFSKNAIARGK